MMAPALAPVDETYAAVVGSVALARRSVARWLHGVVADQLLIGDIALAVSEACTNAVVHGYPNDETGAFRVCVSHAGETVLVTVSDDGGGMIPRPDSPGLGLGLPLMSTLSERLEVRSAALGTGTVVQMRFAAPR